MWPAECDCAPRQVWWGEGEENRGRSKPEGARRGSNEANEGQSPPGKLVGAELFCIAIAILNTAAGTSLWDSFTRSQSKPEPSQPKRGLIVNDPKACPDLLTGSVQSFSGPYIGCGTGDPLRLDVHWLTGTESDAWVSHY